MTEASVALTGVIILAVLGVVVKSLDYINKSVFPQIKELAGNISDLKTAHAVNQVQIDQNTARLNGQSAKIDTLLMATPGIPAPLVTETATDAPVAPVETPPAPVEVPVAPRPVNVTIMPGDTMTAEELAAAHAALDEAAKTTSGAEPFPPPLAETAPAPAPIGLSAISQE